MKNIDLAARVARELRERGVQEVLLCAGARNSPLITVFDALARNGGIQAQSFFEERSAAFFALGRIKAEGRPVAVITTSGTAAAELLPAAIEAYYTGLPLVLITADRPRVYRSTGAPQSIEQKGLFGPYVLEEVDLEAGESWPLPVGEFPPGPIHWNLAFDEPLLDRTFDPVLESIREMEPISRHGRPPASVREDAEPHVQQARERIEAFLSKCRKPLVIVGGLEPRADQARAELESFLGRLGAPIYVEGTSGLRESPILARLAIRSSDRILSENFGVDGVLRVGGVPTLRFWRDLEGARKDLPLLSVSELPFSGSPRSVLVQGSLERIFGGWTAHPVFGAEAHEELLMRDRIQAERISALLAEEPASEPGMIRAWSERIPVGAGVYLGNSLPVREWDLAASTSNRGWEIYANRGANGIDGQTSTFFGTCRRGRAHWALLGDLTALYDLSAPWALRTASPALDARIAIIHNGGGKIFSRLFGNAAFENRHDLSFRPWAEMWGMEYAAWHEVPEHLPFGAGRGIYELRPDPVATDRFWKRYDELWRAPL